MGDDRRRRGRRALGTVGLMAVMLSSVACGGGGGDETKTNDTAGATADNSEAPGGTPSDSDETAKNAGTCRAEFTGDVDFRVDQPGSVPANSDYWLSDDELKSAEQVHSDYDARVAAGQQLLQIFQVACGDAEGVLLMTTDETTRTDVPQAPGTYAVLNFLDKAKPGISAAVTVPGDAIFGVTGGQVTITRFDAKGVAGSFSLDAEEISISVEPGAAPKKLAVTGDFDMPCWSPSAPCV